MTRLYHAGFILLAVLLLFFLALFPLLTLDAVGKLVSRASALEAGNFLLVLYLELSRAFTTMVALSAAISLVVRSARAADGRALALFLIFTALTYEKIFGTTGYPGPLQEKITTALLDAGISRATLLWLFGPVPWSLWLALAALLRFSVVFPRPPLSAAAIDASGRHDRQGMLRGAGIAGFDIGHAVRSISKHALAAGAFRPLPLWTSALILIVVSSVTGATARLLLFVVAATCVTALAIANLRASYNVVAELERMRMRWLLLGFSAGSALFMMAALPLLFFDNPVANVPALVLLMLAPAVIMVCMAVAVLSRGELDAARLLHGVPGVAAHAMALLLSFALATTLFSAITERAGLSPALAVLAALLVTALAFEPMGRLAQRATARILERSPTPS